MNQELIEILEELDNTTQKISEFTISSKLNSVTKDDESLEAKSERIAFSFSENYENYETGWGTYFGPMMVWRGDDGKTYESPSLSQITEEVINYWTKRAQKTKNFLMKARYYGLLWDFMYRVINKKPSYEIAQEYVKSLIETCKRDLCEHPTESIQKITRAYKVACSLNNVQLIKESIDVAIKLEDQIAEDDKAGLWGFCFELFVLGKEKLLSGSQKEKLILDLENRLKRVSQKESPWVCESAGIPLATYYRNIGKTEEVKRIIKIVGQCFEKSCEGQAPMLASSWYQHVYNIYLTFGLRDRADEVSRKISEIGPRVVESMQSFSHATEIPKEKLNAYLEAMIEGGLEAALSRIAIQFIPRKGKVEQQVLELAKNYPLTYLFTKVLQDHRGRPVATIGGIENDLEGNIIHQMSQNMGIESFFLRHSLVKLKETYNPTTHDIANYILNSPIYDDSKRELIEEGVSAFLSEKYITAIHILVPQAEAAIRNLVELSGGAILRKNRHGGLQLRTFDDLLRDDIVNKCFGEDITFYMRVLLTDQRGWNIRNDVCHGISPVGAFNFSVADRVMHVVLCLSLARENRA